MMRKLFSITIAFFLCLLPACGDTGQPPKAPVTVQLKVGPATLTSEIAVTDAEQERGLMFRRHLDDNAGMIFVFAREGQAHFWMKNTLVPLSIAFMDRDGVILQIVDMEPLDEHVIASDSKSILYVLEVNQKWFRLNQVKVGDRVAPVGATLGELKDYASHHP
jgi:uncharacterized membrane protein (UPF0127 family)